MAPEKGVVPPGLKPKEAVKVPKDLFKKLPDEIKALLKKLNDARESGDKEAQRKVRMELRKKGFYLSNIENGGKAPETTEKPKKAAPAKEEKDEEEEDDD